MATAEEAALMKNVRTLYFYILLTNMLVYIYPLSIVLDYLKFLLVYFFNEAWNINVLPP